jgi:hypothetical protein
MNSELEMTMETRLALHFTVLSFLAFSPSIALGADKPTNEWSSGSSLATNIDARIVKLDGQVLHYAQIVHELAIRLVELQQRLDDYDRRFVVLENGGIGRHWVTGSPATFLLFNPLLWSGAVTHDHPDVDLVYGDLYDCEIDGPCKLRQRPVER